MTLLVFLHPHCPCSRASIDELAKIMTHSQNRLNATVLVVRPAGAPNGWEKTDLWQSAAAIPGVDVIADLDGEESSRFGVATSGQVLLYSTSGRLIFCGGITETRGHSGDNAGRTAIVTLSSGPFPARDLELNRSLLHSDQKRKYRTCAERATRESKLL